jgi:glucokinase-like ROK family protein
MNPKGGYVVGIKLTEAAAICALTDLDASVIAKTVVPLSGHHPEQVVADLSRTLPKFIQGHGIARKQLLGVGIGLAGIVDAENGLLRQSPIYGWRDVPLLDMLQSRLRIPVYIENDVNTLTLTEKWFGHGQGLDDFLTVTVGRGVGLGIVANGQFYHGQIGGAGELGHTVIDPDGPACECGKRGCLEAYVGDPALVRAANEAVAHGQLPGAVETVEELVDYARQGSPAAREIFARAGRILGMAIANLITLFDPQKIIISGEGTRAGSFLFDPMKEAIRKNTLPGLYAERTVEIAEWGDDAWARGAAGMVLREVFESPIHRKRAAAPLA